MQPHNHKRAASLIEKAGVSQSLQKAQSVEEKIPSGQSHIEVVGKTEKSASHSDGPALVQEGEQFIDRLVTGLAVAANPGRCEKYALELHCFLLSGLAQGMAPGMMGGSPMMGGMGPGMGGSMPSKIIYRHCVCYETLVFPSVQTSCPFPLGSKMLVVGAMAALALS